MSISGPIKYVNLFLQDIVKADHEGTVAEFAATYKSSARVRQLIALLYPNIRIVV